MSAMCALCEPMKSSDPAAWMEDLLRRLESESLKLKGSEFLEFKGSARVDGIGSYPCEVEVDLLVGAWSVEITGWEGPTDDHQAVHLVEVLNDDETRVIRGPMVLGGWGFNRDYDKADTSKKPSVESLLKIPVVAHCVFVSTKMPRAVKISGNACGCDEQE